MLLPGWGSQDPDPGFFPEGFSRFFFLAVPNHSSCWIFFWTHHDFFMFFFYAGRASEGALAAMYMGWLFSSSSSTEKDLFCCMGFPAANKRTAIHWFHSLHRANVRRWHSCGCKGHVHRCAHQSFSIDGPLGTKNYVTLPSTDWNYIQ